MPLQGASRPISEGVSNGIKMALEEAGDRAGDISVTYESLDDATAQAGALDAGGDLGERPQARRRTTATAVYIGELNSGATAVSLPILNEAGVAQISRRTRRWA